MNVVIGEFEVLTEQVPVPAVAEPGSATPGGTASASIEPDTQPELAFAQHLRDALRLWAQ